ncbi:MAG: hypothetical protein ACRDKW_03310, partial [Actinomycetota bacterium]
MRIQDPLRGGSASRLAAGLVLALHLAVTPLQAAPAGSTEVVDRVNGFTLVLPAGWSAAVPKEGAVDGATVLRWPAPGEPLPRLHEGVPGESLKIQITAVERDRYREAGAMTDPWPVELRSSARPAGDREPENPPLATRVAGLAAVVSTRTWSSGAPVLEIVMTAGDGRVLVADVLPAGSPRLLEALTVLETIRVDGLPDEAAPTAGSAVERAAKLADLVTATAMPPAASGGLMVTSPERNAQWYCGETHTIAWTPSNSPSATIELLNPSEQVVSVISPGTDDDGALDW